MPTLNATVFPAEAYVLVEADWSGAVLRDTFSRTLPSSWGNPDFGPIWQDLNGTGANRSVNAIRGLITHTAVGGSLREVSAFSTLNVEGYGQFFNTVMPTGDIFEWSMYCRFVDLSNFIHARVFLSTAGTVTCDIRQMIAGVPTVGATTAVPGVSSVDNFEWRLRAQGSTVLLKVWRLGTAEPLTWTNSFTTTWVTAGGGGVQTFLPAGVTNAMPLTFQWDNFLFVDIDHADPLYAQVTRRNTVTGEIVTLRPYIAYDEDGNLLLECGIGLWWDTEPPLNVPLEYCAVSEALDVNLAQNCCFESGSVIPWAAFFGTLTNSTAFAHEGTRSALLTPNGVNSSPQFQQVLAAIPHNVETTVSAWAMSPQGWNAVWLSVRVAYTDSTAERFDSPIEILDDGEWRFLTATFTPAAKPISSVVVSFITGGTPAATTLFYVDEFRLTQKQSAAATACETVTVSSESVWLKSPLNPCSDVEVGLCSPMLEDCEEDARVSYVGHEPDEYAPNTSLWQPVNQIHPIPINRVRRDATSVFRVLAHDCEARDAVLLINEPGDPLLFQAPATYCIPDRYISVGIVSESRISVDQREDFRLMTIPYATVKRPSGPANGVCGARIDDLCDIYTSWAAMTIAGLTWTDLLLGEASPNGPGQPEPPAGARTWDDVNAEFANWTAVDAGGTRDWNELEDGL